MKIKTKLQAVSIAPVLVFLVLMAVQSGLSVATDRRHEQEEVVSSLGRDISDLITLTYECGISQGLRAKMQWTVQEKQIEVLLKESNTLFKEPDELKLLDDFRSLLANADRRFRALSEFDAEVRKPGQAYGIRNNMINGLILEIQELSPLVDKMQVLIDAATTRLSRYMNIMTGVSGVMFILLISPVLFFTIKRITFPLDNLRKSMGIIAAGNLQHRVRVDSTDEVGVLSQGFNEMAVRLQEVTVSRDYLNREVEERNKLAEILRQANAYNRSLIEAALDPLVTIGQDGKITDVNTATEIICGYSREQLIGSDFSDYFSDPEKARSGYQHVFREGVVRDYALEIRHRDGRLTPVLYNASLYKDSAGTVIGVFAAARDISDRKKAEEAIRSLNAELEQRVTDRTAKLEMKSTELNESQMALMNIVEDLNQKTDELEQANVKLKELDQLKSLFIASMSHELRTPLNSIIGFSSIMLNEWTGPLTAEQKENLSAVLRAGKHLLSLINDVIDVSKIEAGKIELIAEEFDVRDVVMEAFDTLKKDVEKKGLECEITMTSASVRTDRRRLLQCILNLMSNAVKYTDKGSISVSMQISNDSRFLDFNVIDTGIGIHSEDLEKLFAPFVRIVSPMRPVVQGTGLGLYLTRKIAREVLKGDILLESTFGAGSRFTLRLPLEGN